MANRGGADQSLAVSAATTGLAWVGKAALVAGSVAMGGCCLLAFRHCSRVAKAQNRLQDLLREVAGTDTRIVITGATSGIGKELARQLHRNPSVSLLLGCRDTKAARAIFPEGIGNPIMIKHLELLDFDSVQNFADEAHEFLKDGDKGLRVLVNNAGVMLPEGSGTTPSGPDVTWRTNFFSPFLITELINRRRRASRPEIPLRVVQVSSRLEKRSKLSEEDLKAIAIGKSGQNPYSDSKRAVMLWTSVRAPSLALTGSVFSHCATPGMVDTQLGRHSMPPWIWPLTKPLRMILLRSPVEGAYSVVAAALQPNAVEEFGRYFDGEKQIEDLTVGRLKDKDLSEHIVKWAAEATQLETRNDGYGR